MANELRIADVTGLTYTCEVRQIDNTIIGSAVSLTEDGSSGRYYGDFPSGSASSNTEYDLVYIQDSTIEATERRYWNGSKLLGSEDLLTATGFSTHTAADVWTATTRTLTSFGTLIADIWTYVTRTLTSSANVTTSSLSGSAIEITRAVTFTNQWTGLTIPATWSKAYFTVKSNQLVQSDNEASVQLVVTNPADGGDGLIRLNGAATTAAYGTLVVDQAGGSITATITDEATADLTICDGQAYDLKLVLSTGVSELTLRSGVCGVVSTPTRAIT